jgi:hypothetical protein
MYRDSKGCGHVPMSLWDKRLKPVDEMAGYAQA